MNKHVALSGLVLAGCLVGASASAAVNAYLIVDGRPGPSTSKAGAIDILSFSFNGSNPATVVNANLTCAGLSVTKKVDRVSPVLREDHKRGVKYRNAVLSVVDGDTSAETVVIRLDGLSMVPGKAPISSGGEDPTESFSLQFSKMTVSYPPGAGRAPITLNCH